MFCFGRTFSSSTSLPSRAVLAGSKPNFRHRALDGCAMSDVTDELIGVLDPGCFIGDSNIAARMAIESVVPGAEVSWQSKGTDIVKDDQQP